MSRLLNVSDLTSLVASHAQQLRRTKRKSVLHDKRLMAAVLAVLQAVEARAVGMPEIAALVQSVRHVLCIESE